MRGLKIAGIVVGALLVIGVLLYIVVVRQAGPAFDESYSKSFLESCLKSASETASRQGRTGPEADAAVQRYCSCALDVVKPMSVADKIALNGSEAKQREVTMEIQKRCR